MTPNGWKLTLLLLLLTGTRSANNAVIHIEPLVELMQRALQQVTMHHQRTEHLKWSTIVILVLLENQQHLAISCNKAVYCNELKSTIQFIML